MSPRPSVSRRRSNTIDGKCATIERVNTLEQEKAKAKAGHSAKTLTRFDLVILDEFGGLPSVQRIRKRAAL